LLLILYNRERSEREKVDPVIHRPLTIPAAAWEGGAKLPKTMTGAMAVLVSLGSASVHRCYSFCFSGFLIVSVVNCSLRIEMKVDLNFVLNCGENVLRFSEILLTRTKTKMTFITACFASYTAW